MSRLLQRLLGRLPIGWLQLVHNRTRFAAALAGVSFAVILVFVQLGVLGALNASVVTPYRQFDADAMISAADASTLTEGSNVPRQWMHQALSVPGVAAAAPLFVGSLDWSREDGTTTALQLLAVDPARADFVAAPLRAELALLMNADWGLVDDKTRGVAPGAFAGVGPASPFTFEAAGRAMRIVGTVSIGGGFSADGYLFVSDQTFLRFFPRRVSGAPSHILLRFDPAADAPAVLAAIRAAVPAEHARVRGFAEAAEEDRRYQTTERPTGLIFGFGVAMGAVVGVIIVYQILATDVADHLGEYATFKAIGYRHRFFLGVVFEEAAILALLGFAPGFLVSIGLYAALSGATGLPVAMDASRALGVFAGTLGACMLSGAVATRRLRGADPADLF